MIAHNDLFSAGADRHCIYVVGPTWTGGVPDPTFANGTQYSSAFNGDGITKNIVIADNYLKMYQLTIQDGRLSLLLLLGMI